MDKRTSTHVPAGEGQKLDKPPGCVADTRRDALWQALTFALVLALVALLWR